MFCSGNNMGCLCIVHNLSPLPPKTTQTTQLHTPEEQPTEYSMFYIKYMGFTRPLSCERPLKLSKVEDCLLFILHMFNAKPTKLPRSVRALDPPKDIVILVSIFISCRRSPTLNLQFLTSILIRQEKLPNGKSLCRSVRFTKPGPQL